MSQPIHTFLDDLAALAVEQRSGASERARERSTQRAAESFVEAVHAAMVTATDAPTRFAHSHPQATVWVVVTSGGQLLGSSVNSARAALMDAGHHPVPFPREAEDALLRAYETAGSRDQARWNRDGFTLAHVEIRLTP